MSKTKAKRPRIVKKIRDMAYKFNKSDEGISVLENDKQIKNDGKN